MIVEFFDRQQELNPANGSRISRAPELLAVLDALRDRPPFLAELVGDNGYKLLLGLGGPVGCAQYSPVDGASPYLMATRPEADDAVGFAQFLIGNTPTPIPARYCLPFDIVREIAGYFAETGKRSPALSWEEI